MASVNSKLNTALSDLVSGNIWPLSKPAEEDPDVFIVYNPEVETPDDFGDDTDHEWMVFMQVHWYARGMVNYLREKVKIRNRLKSAGFTVSEVAVVEYANDLSSSASKSGSGWTHLCFTCNIPEDDPYGES